MKVALFVTCFNDVMYPQTGQAVVTLLERLGCRVEFPRQQTCCGQMHFNTGYRTDAATLARKFGKDMGGFDAVVVPSGSCTAMIRGHYHTLGAGTGGAPVYELSEFLIDVLGVTDVGAYFPHRVTYHPTCHSLRMLGVGDRPLQLLRAVRGIDLVELPAAESCCGFGGTFALKNAATSTAMMTDKIRCILNSGAEIVTAGDNSCLAHIGGGLSRLRTGVRPLHLAEILASTESQAA